MSEFAFDVSIENFEAQVLIPADTVPVVVDFWAPWCQPCQTLKPMLEKLAEEYKGRFLLAKVNSDENPELAQHFGVRSIPSVKVLFQGQLVDEFNGALPESQVREFLDRIALPAGPEHADLRQVAAGLVAEGKLEEALATLVQASQANPQDQAIQLDAVEVLMQLGRNDEAKQLLGGDYANEAERANALRARLALLDGAADIAPLEAKLAANADDHATRLELSKAYAAQGRFREALEAALEVVRRDRFFDQGAGRAAILSLFEALNGEQYDDLVREFRRKLSATLN
ncbi:tetratricopeptide repeat protein [Dechloromonas sp.]|uniref:tetratricopeptide repeat protein n=1 Tax=Dechloromonas sp. TaxID=1917218 RepID=UPI00121CE7D8|nr:tetratricopeptide repeat protein [Dechloromonas sp.]MBU3696317.1 tetratricopeptide repeat protein [Dechloromonas sp.]TEX49173.1 MAG: co-chaperone YbbN [Rhodocyclaceae bacterium]